MLTTMGAGTERRPVSRSPGREGAAARGAPAPSRNAPAAAPPITTSRPAGGYDEDRYATLTRIKAAHPMCGAYQGDDKRWHARRDDGTPVTRRSLPALEMALDAP